MLTGLECQSGAVSRLYLTNGVKHLEVAVGDPSKCEFTPVGSCDVASAFHGLARVPGWSLKIVGTSCLGTACPGCPQMTLRPVGGDPSLGNPAFGVDISGGPAGSVAAVLIRADSCTAPLPFLCGSFYADTPIIPLLKRLTGVGCDGSARVGLPIPPNAAFGGIDVCLQVVIGCPNGGGGLTNAIQIPIVGS